jgi:hypothetical protein
MVTAVERVLVPLGVEITKPLPLAKLRGQEDLRSQPRPQQSVDRDADVAGGYFIYLTLPTIPHIPPLAASIIAANCKSEENLTIITGERFRVDGDEDNPATQFDRDIRLCFAWEEEGMLEEGVRRLGRVIGRALEEGKRDRG